MLSLGAPGHQGRQLRVPRNSPALPAVAAFPDGQCLAPGETDRAQGDSLDDPGVLALEESTIQDFCGL